jgi:hypothetical protein
MYEVDRGQAKSTLTVLFTFSASGTITAPMIIYPYKRLPSEISVCAKVMGNWHFIEWVDEIQALL